MARIRISGLGSMGIELFISGRTKAFGSITVRAMNIKTPIDDKASPHLGCLYSSEPAGLQSSPEVGWYVRRQLVERGQ